MSRNQLLVQDFRVGETTESFEFNGKKYIALLIYNPKQDMRSSLYIYEGVLVPPSKEGYVYYAWISALAADFTGCESSTSWYISDAVEPDESIRPLFLDTMLRSFMTRPENSSIASFRIGSPKFLIETEWLQKYNLVYQHNDTIIVRRDSICPEKTPLCELLTLV